MNIIIPKMSEKTIELPGKSEIFRGLLLIALARAGFAGRFPLGLAFAAAFPAEHAYIALIGLAAGLAGAKIAALKYILAFFCFYVTVYAGRARSPAVKATALGVSLTLSGLVSFLWTGAGGWEILLLLPEAAAAACAYRLFMCLGERSEAGGFALLLAAGGALGGLRDAVLPYIELNIAVFAAFFGVMSLCLASDLPSAAVRGAVIGFLMYADTPGAVTMAGTFAVAAVFSALLARLGKAGAAAGFLCGITVCALYAGRLEFRVIDIFMPSAIFMLLPEGLHCRIGCAIGDWLEEEYDEPDIGAEIAAKLETAARAVRELADGVTLAPGGGSDASAAAELFGAVSARVCEGCSLEDSCRKNVKMRENMLELLQVMESEGFCDYTNLPLGFRQVCIRSESFLCEFKHVYEMYKQNTLHHGEAISERGIIARQYTQIAGLIRHLSREVREAPGDREQPAARFAVSVTAAQEPKCGQSVCGDTLVHFERGGKYFVILCDGMGSGEAALSESRLTARLFSEFLKAGFEKETALSMINSALALKADQESFSTVDLLEINLESGAAEFLKIGSAQSFLKTKSSIEVISSRALPVGILEEVEAQAESFELRGGDLILMMSDGVGEAAGGILKNDWIKKLLMMENRSDEELARLILSGARARMKFSDDITGVVIRIKRRKGGAE